MDPTDPTPAETADRRDRDSLSPILQAQYDVALLRGHLPGDRIAEAVALHHRAVASGRPYDIAEAVAELAGLTRSGAEEIRRQAKERALRGEQPPAVQPVVGRAAIRPGPARPTPATSGAAIVGLVGGVLVVVGLAVALGGPFAADEAPELADGPTAPRHAPAVEPDRAPIDDDPADAPPAERPDPPPAPDPEPPAAPVPSRRLLENPVSLRGWLLDLSDEEFALLLPLRRFTDYVTLVVDALDRRAGERFSPESDAFLEAIERRKRRVRNLPR